MEHTKNFNLTQWALTDPVRMEDFNADNARLEAALTALSAGPELLLEREEADGGFSITSYGLKDLLETWDRWSAIVLYINGEADYNEQDVIRVALGKAAFDLPKGPVVACFLPLRDGGRHIQGFALTAEGCRMLEHSLSFEAAETLVVQILKQPADPSHSFKKFHRLVLGI